MKNDLVFSIASAVGLVTLALAVSYLSPHYIDAETVDRIVMAAIGLVIAWSGNRIPKALAPSHSAAKAARVSGWSTALSGLVYAGLWAFAPPSVAIIGGSGAIIAGLLVTVFYCLSLRRPAGTA